MPGIYWAALITSVFCVAVWGGVIKAMPGPAPRGVILTALLVALPLQPLAYYLVRMPFHHWLSTFGEVSLWIAILYAPITEELAKLVPLLVPAVRRALTPENCARIALAIGLGFGLGEAWFIAYEDAKVEAIASLPFWLLGGYLGERFMVCCLHAAFVAFSLRWRWGILAAMLAHLGLNFPIALASMRVLPLTREQWSMALGLWTAVYFIAAMAWLSRLSLGRWDPGEMVMGRARCPGCSQVYGRPLLLGFNLGVRRYERCPHCRKWHFTGEKDLVT